MGYFEVSGCGSLTIATKAIGLHIY